MSDTVSFQDGLPPRPWCCPEPRCVPVHLLIDGDATFAPGESFVCFGDAPEVPFEYDGVRHANDARSCHYTPLKGLIAYQENAADWDALRSAYWRVGLALHARREMVATESETTDAGMGEGVISLHNHAHRGFPCLDPDDCPLAIPAATGDG